MKSIVFTLRERARLTVKRTKVEARYPGHEENIFAGSGSEYNEQGSMHLMTLHSRKKKSRVGFYIFSSLTFNRNK
jgi:hypothetical protein